MNSLEQAQKESEIKNRKDYIKNNLPKMNLADKIKWSFVRIISFYETIGGGDASRFF